MIERMKLVHIVTSAEKKTEMLSAVRDLGVVHLAEKKSADQAPLERFQELSSTLMALGDYADGKTEPLPLMEGEAFEALHKRVSAALERKKSLEAEKTAALLEAEKLAAWGEFDPEAVRALAFSGLDFHFYRMGKKELKQLREDENVRFIRLASVEKMETVAVIGKLPLTFQASEFALPGKSLGTLRCEAEAAAVGIGECEETLREAARAKNSYEAALLKAQNETEFSAAGRSACSAEGLVWLTGYVPESSAEEFRAAAGKNCWAYAMEDAAEDDEFVPTKVKYTKFTALIEPVFGILGTVPGYAEYDTSFWFLCFFTLFFAMIIGDAGYGVLFLIGAVVLQKKTKKLSNAVLLLYVLSAATVVWGALTGTWFGSKAILEKLPFLQKLIIPGFANYPELFGVSATAQQNNIMKFCFSIGLVQMDLACVMNIRRKIGRRDLSFVADLGWLIGISALYFMVLFLVIGQSVNLGLVAGFVVTGFVLVVTFGGQAPGQSFGTGLKAGLGGAFTTFLDTISAFGNVMSYIRLFAVGMASLAIAQSFNDMASGLGVAGVIVILIGHVLNIVMGFLSVVVHGVRLNLLEFSGQLGMEWSGKSYDPFRKLDKIRK